MFRRLNGEGTKTRKCELDAKDVTNELWREGPTFDCESIGSLA